MTVVIAQMTSVVAAPRREPVRLAFTTPGLLRMCLGGTWVLSAVFLLAAATGLERYRQAVQTIGKDSAPSIVAAQRLRTTFARCHADAAALLAGQAGAATAYDGDRRAAADGLVAAAQNITYGDAELKPVQRMVDAYGRYGAAVARGRVSAESGAATPLAEADGILHGELLADADALDRANRHALDGGYTDERTRAAFGMAWTVAAGVALLTALVGTQVFVARRTQRLFNPPLVVASAVTLASLAWVVAGMSASAADLRTAKADAFDSLSALWQARSTAVDGYATRLAGVPGTRAADDATLLASPPLRMTLDDVVVAVEGGTVPDGFNGYLADELRNITFPGERAAAVDALRTYAAYRADGGPAAFARFDDAVGKTIEVNQSAFDHSVGEGFTDVDGRWAWAAGAAAVVAVAAYVGLRPRLREYAA